MTLRVLAVLAALPFIAAAASSALGAENRNVGSITTKWRPLGANDIISIDAIDDPDVPGITCYLSHAKAGSHVPLNPFTEDSSDASIACRQVGPVDVNLEALKKKGDVDIFTESQNIWFKKMHVRRIVDIPRRTLIYVTFSGKIIDGSPKNAITAVPLQSWR